MSINMRAPFLLSKGLQPLLMAAPRNTASIVNVASVHSFATGDSCAVYAASKGYTHTSISSSNEYVNSGGLTAMTRALAIELGSRYGIRVNAVCPGAVDTPLHRDHLRLGSEQNSPDIDNLVQEFSKKSVCLCTVVCVTSDFHNVRLLDELVNHVK
jgi:NAD(P)-dependent dehydrogenase (short-subunit alcohol dehydrogenase family)